MANQTTHYQQSSQQLRCFFSDLERMCGSSNCWACLGLRKLASFMYSLTFIMWSEFCGTLAISHKLRVCYATSFIIYRMPYIRQKCPRLTNLTFELQHWHHHAPQSDTPAELRKVFWACVTFFYREAEASIGDAVVQSVRRCSCSPRTDWPGGSNPAWYTDKSQA